MRFAVRCAVVALLLLTPAVVRADLTSWLPFSKSRTNTVAKKTKNGPSLSGVSSTGSKSPGQTTGFFTSKKTVPRKTSTAKNSVPKSKYEEPTFWQKLFGTEPAPPPRTVGEWMSLEQIHP